MKKISGLGQRIESLGSLNRPTSVVELKRKIALANHRKPDLIIKNANIVNVFSGEIYNANVAIADGIFVGIWDVEGGVDTENINAESVFDAQGRFMSPGLIDGHIHIESTFLSPTEFCNIVVPHGTSAGICDPMKSLMYLVLMGLTIYYNQLTINQ